MSEQSNSKVLESLKQGKEIFWPNPDLLAFEEALAKGPYSFADVQDVENRLQRFAPFIQKAFPETVESQGIIESTVTHIPEMKEWLSTYYNQDFAGGELWLKRDDLLPISGTIKARGAIYEVLKHAETLALEAGLLKSLDDDYSQFASEKSQNYFADYNITVGTTGNLGISVGTMGRALGFDVTVHMSTEAKEWKKEYLRSRGVDVVEHKTNFTRAVEEGRAASEANPRSYFVDDENSEELFLGYTVGGYRMKHQLAEEGIQVDADHPLFVYLPCGIGGSPSGITYGLKHAFGDNVHCIFAEPTKMPSMLLGLETQKFDGICAADIGQGGLTVADGLAVPRTSALVAKIIRYYFSAGYTLTDDTFRRLLTKLYETEGIFLEPAAVAGLLGPTQLLKTEEGQRYLDEHSLTDKMDQATHIAWATGGSMVPDEDKRAFVAEGQNL